MKKFLIASAFLGSALFLAQNVAVDPMLDKDLMTWYHKDFSVTKIYGVNTQNAYKFLESKGLKPKNIVVAVLDGGVEVDHPGLKNNIWTNPNEVPNNGKDDDGNGYIDDIHGWNFLGGKNGDVEFENLEKTRIVKKYKPLFEGPNSKENKANQAKLQNEFKVYLDARNDFIKESTEARQNLLFYAQFSKEVPAMVSILNGKNFTAENINNIQITDSKQAQYQAILSQYLKDPNAIGKSSQELQNYLTEQLAEAVKTFSEQVNYRYNLDFDARKVIGDNSEDINEKSYGNNHYEGPDAHHGTHVSGIVAGLPNGKEIQYGVASKVAKIMSVRVVPNGDENDKDIANGIRYAVDNGAKIINMSFGKRYSPNKEKVWEAMQYAQQKGVLLVHGAGNDNVNIEEKLDFPTNFKDTKDASPFVDNYINVGASTNNPDFLRADFSNFSGKMVDVFAPGEKIYSTVTDGKYKYEQGTSMASPVVAGAAAVLLAYMPTLSPSQIIESLVNTANKSEVNAMLPTNTNNRFDLISRSGGVIDLRKAAEYAYNNFYKKASLSALPSSKSNVAKKAKKKIKK